MKKRLPYPIRHARYLLAVVLLFLLSLSGVAQESFVFKRIIDSLEKDKSQLYTETKIFIAENYKNAIAVTMLDDKENGIIILKPVTMVEVIHSLGLQKNSYLYKYTFKFQFKDTKVRVSIDQVHCSSATTTGKYVPKKIEPYDSMTPNREAKG